MTDKPRPESKVPPVTVAPESQDELYRATKAQVERLGRDDKPTRKGTS